MSGPERVVVDVLPSAYWVTARVIVLECGHRHVRPLVIAPALGEMFECYACAEGKPAWHDPAIHA